jgi:hypothetical protein
MGPLIVSVFERRHETTMSVGFPDGESAYAFFFPEPESREEAELQIPSKLMLVGLVFCDEYCRRTGGSCGEGGCPACERARFWYALAVVADLLLFGIAPAASVIGISLIVLSAVPFAWWLKRTRPARERRRLQRRYLAPVQSRLLEFAKEQDFAGALAYAMRVREESLAS